MAVYRTNDGLVTFTLGPDTPGGAKVREKTVSSSLATIPATQPTLWTKAKRLRAELVTWRKAGYRIAPRQVRAERSAICTPCPFYSRTGNFGLGECRAPGCGCSRAKLWLASTRCPLPVPKWLPVAAEPAADRSPPA